MLRRIFLNKKITLQNVGRFYCATSSSKLLNVDVNDKTGVAIVTLNRPPVNGLNLDLLTEISNCLDDLEANKSKGMILTSASKTVFTAGLDIMEMYKPDAERLKLFWSTLQDVWLKLYGTTIPTVAAINGHSPAGGCLLALCCEYRIMCPSFTIGLNETKLGIVAPPWFHASMRNVISMRETERALINGTLFTTDEAFKIGLVDEIATDKADAIKRGEVFLSKFKKMSPQARGLTKQICRKKDLQELEENREHDLQMFLHNIIHPMVQKGLDLYMQSLKKN